MPSYVLKASPDEDLYAIYSTIVDAIVFIGPRGETRQHLLHQDGINGKPDERLARADQNGSSCLIDSDGTGVWYGWNDEAIRIMEGPGGPGRLPRANLSAYLRALEVADEATAEDLVTANTSEGEGD